MISRIWQNPLTDLSFILKRLWRQRGLVACVALGLMVATALAVTIPLYADAANYNLLNTALANSAAQTHRPPFSFIFNYVGSWHGPITVAQYTPPNQYMETGLQGAIGLPLESLTRLVSTDNLQLYPNQLPLSVILLHYPGLRLNHNRLRFGHDDLNG